MSYRKDIILLDIFPVGDGKYSKAVVVFDGILMARAAKKYSPQSFHCQAHSGDKLAVDIDLRKGGRFRLK